MGEYAQIAADRVAKMVPKNENRTFRSGPELVSRGVVKILILGPLTIILFLILF
jgi:hypothetical protein